MMRDTLTLYGFIRLISVIYKCCVLFNNFISKTARCLISSLKIDLFDYLDLGNIIF